MEGFPRTTGSVPARYRARSGRVFGSRQRKLGWTVAVTGLSAILTVSPMAFADEPVPDPPPVPETPSAVTIETLLVDAASGSGTDTKVPLVQDQTYLVRVSGVASFGIGNADAECAQFPPSSPTWKREYFLTAPNTADVLVNKNGVEWIAETPDVENCDSTNHVYTLFVIPDTTKPYNFMFNDPGGHHDNSGRLQVEIILTGEVPPRGTLVDQFTFSAAAPAGATSSAVLAANRSYRVQVSGRFTYDGGGVNGHDAECLHRTDTPGTREDGFDELGQTPDVYVNRTEIDWVPIEGFQASDARPLGCDDRTNTYIHELAAGTGAGVNLRVNDTWHGDNSGLLSVKIFDMGPAGSADPALSVPIPGGPAATDAVSSAQAGQVFVEQFSVDSRSPNGATTSTALVGGRTYIIEATGLVRFGNGTADAECAAFDILPIFKREHFTNAVNTADLWVDGAGHEWTSTVPDAQGCNTTDHAYTLFFVPDTTKRVTLLFNDDGYRGDNSGSFAVRIFTTNRVAPAGTEIESFGFSAANQSGGTTSVSLASNRSYRIVASGVFGYGGGNMSDPECLQRTVPNGPSVGERHDGLDTAGGTPDVLIDQQEVSWIPMASPLGAQGCDDDAHIYMREITGDDAPVNLRVRDTWYGDNNGRVDVRIFDLGPGRPTPPGGAPVQPPEGLPSLEQDTSGDTVLVSQFTVDSRSAAGTSTTVPLVQGQAYLIEASGLVQFGLGAADAECANFVTVPTFKREYFTAAPHTTDLVIDDVGREWNPDTPDGEGCDTANHAYSLFFEPPTTKAYNFKFNDGGYRGDNSGSFSVRIFKTSEVQTSGSPIDQFVVQAAHANGANSSVSLASNRVYRIVAAGLYQAAPNSQHDAECSYNGVVPTGDREELLDDRAGTPDLLVNNLQRSWIPQKSLAGRNGCDDENHTYVFDLSGHTGPVNLKVRDTWHADNSGQVVVKVYDLGTPA